MNGRQSHLCRLTCPTSAAAENDGSRAGPFWSLGFLVTAGYPDGRRRHQRAQGTAVGAVGCFIDGTNGRLPVLVAVANTGRFEVPAVSIRLAFADDDVEAAFWRQLAGHSVQITEPDDGPCADYVLTGTWRWNDLLSAGEIGVRACSVVTNEAIGETFTVVLTGEERVFVYGLAGAGCSLMPPTDPITPARQAHVPRAAADVPS